MGCCYQSRSPSSYEYSHPFKPENNSGCCGKNNGCDTPSSAREGSPLWNWEQIYGKVVTIFTDTYDENGHVQHNIERIPCPKTTKSNQQTTCCAVKYRFVR